jgi:uncharacterized protein YkwD
MRFICRTFVFSLALAMPLFASAQPQPQPQLDSPYQQPAASDMRAASAEIFARANEARVQAGAGRLEWDPALAAAALYHCRRMVSEGPIAHRYGGEPDLSERAAQAGARFGIIEENVAIGPSAEAIHEEWMNSPGHRENLLNPEVDRVGIAVIASRGVLYSVADYSHAVLALSPSQIEARVAGLVRVSGVAIVPDPGLARAACAADSGMPRAAGGAQPRFIMRWQDSDLSRLPQALVDRLSSGNYREASIGSCPAAGDQNAFSAYRIAVLLY